MKKRKGKCLSIEDESGPADAKRNCTLKRRRLKTTTTHQMSWHEPFVSRRSHTHTHTQKHISGIWPRALLKVLSLIYLFHCNTRAHHSRLIRRTATITTASGVLHLKFSLAFFFRLFFLPYEKGKHNTVHSFVMARHGDERGVRAPTHTRSNEYK